MNNEKIFLVSGTGDVVEPDDNVIAIGSGGPFALIAARALMKYSSLDAVKIVKEAMSLTAEICIYTNSKLMIEVLE
jgi:ATP-dependent HslUV protease subunit HslV